MTQLFNGVNFVYRSVEVYLTFCSYLRVLVNASTMADGINGNVQLNWPKLFQAFSVNFTLIFFHECVHSIIPHQHM